MSQIIDEIKQLKNQRAAKKRSITQRVNQLSLLVSEGGSRTKIRFLYEALINVHVAAKGICERIETLVSQTDDEYDYEWLDQVTLKIDECSAEVVEYLDARKDDTSSDDSLTRSWVAAHTSIAADQENTDEVLSTEVRFSVEQSDLPTCQPDDYPLVGELNSLFATWDQNGQVPTSSFRQPVSGFGSQFDTWRSSVNVSEELSGSSTTHHTYSVADDMLYHTPMSFPNSILRPSNLFPRASNPAYSCPMSSSYSDFTSSRQATSHQDYSCFPSRSFVNFTSSRPANARTVFSNGAQGGNPTVHSSTTYRHVNEVDSWIDELNESRRQQLPDPTVRGISAELSMAWLVQQSLPRGKIPFFDGAPLSWVPFITKFFTLVHKQKVLTDEQRSVYLHDHLDGEAKRSVSAFAHDTRGYIMALKRLKFLFGEKSKIAQAYLAKVIRGKQVADDDVSGLIEFFYTVSDCLVALRKLNYVSDLFSTETLRQAVRRLPSKLHMKWAEQSLRIRQRGAEPSLVEFESWLQSRVLAYKETPKRQQQQQRNDRNNRGGSNQHDSNTMINTTMTKEDKGYACFFCCQNHKISKCDAFLKLTPSKRFEAAQRKKLCLNCLSSKHSTKCQSRNTCFVNGCNERHHTLLHDHFVAKVKSVNPDPPPPDENKDSFNAVVKSTMKQVFLQVVPVILHSPSGETMATHALLDDGSESTLLREDIAEKLNLCGRRHLLNISTVIEKSRESISSKEVKLDVSSTDGDFRISLDSVFVVPPTMFRMPGRPSLDECDYFTHLDGVDINAVSPDEITLLIGADVPEAHIISDVRIGRKDRPLAVRTKFAWTLFGPSVKQASSQSANHTSTSISHLKVIPTPHEQIDATVKELWSERNFKSHASQVNMLSTSDDNLQDLVESFWKQEHVAIIQEKDTAPSIDDHQLLKKLEAETKLENEHYIVPMLWDKRVTELPNNIALAKKRFRLLKMRLQSNSELYDKYKAVIDNYVAKGYARRLSTEEANVIRPKTYYLPHHPVFNPNKLGKIRVVNDAAATFNGTSLNGSLKTGPDLLNSLVGVIIRFRSGRVAIAADIEDMFHQVQVPEDDRDSLRFLWTDDVFSDKDPYVMQMTVHIFGAKDSPTCANYAVKRTARDNHHKVDPLTYETALKSFYVDDLLKSVNSEEVAVTLAQELIDLMKCGGFRLTKFLSNSKVVIDSLPTSEISPSVTVDLDSDNLQRALGISWDVRSDKFTFSVNLPEAPMTKRGILRVTCSLFDPLGFITPFILKAKILLQELWRRDFDWDDTIDEESAVFWRKWLCYVKNVTNVSIDRCYNSYFDDPIIEIQLHVFSDASELAYGPVAYLRFSYKSGRHSCAFVMAKSKLAPIKTVSLPRLELNAAVTGVRMYKTIISESDLPVERVCFWTDSTLTLQYITNTTHRPKIYVANRQTEINEATSLEDWRHVPGHLNPADLLTRGVGDPNQLLEPNKHGTFWYTGPAFLLQDEVSWPTTTVDPIDPYDSELKKKSVLVALGIVETKPIEERSDSIELDIISVERFSTWRKLNRVVGWVRRFLHNLFTVRLGKPGNVWSGDLSCAELENSEMAIVHLVQRDCFSDEIHRLTGEGKLPVKNKLSPLSPFVDSCGSLRVGGRLKNAPIPPAAKHQLILPKDHPVSKLLIIHDHRRNGHVGKEHVLANLREKYWIVNGRSAVKSVLRKCFFCRFRRARQQYPYMASLPRGRLAYEEPPFTHCGVDLFGPIFIKQGRKRLKRWAVLFTCLSVRCVHLDLVESIDTDDFINCLRRFTNRRGCPKRMYSDCGTNFKGATKELKEAIRLLDHDRIGQFATSQMIEWRFNPPSAPHMGGVWERMVRSCKEVLLALMENKVLTNAQLYTLLTEVENILNRRPLIPCSDDVDDLGALTPNHILLGLHSNWNYACETNESDATSRRKYRQVQAIAKQFWSRWRREYLPQLTKRDCWRGDIENYKVGELVILIDDDQRRGKWPLGRITRVLPGKNDDIVRVVEVRTRNGVYLRPVHKLCRLEGD